MKKLQIDQTLLVLVEGRYKELFNKNKELFDYISAANKKTSKVN